MSTECRPSTLHQKRARIRSSIYLQILYRDDEDIEWPQFSAKNSRIIAPDHQHMLNGAGAGADAGADAGAGARTGVGAGIGAGAGAARLGVGARAARLGSRGRRLQHTDKFA